MISGRTRAGESPDSLPLTVSGNPLDMLHTPIPDRLVRDDRRLPPAAGILIAMGGSVILWGAIYAACILSF